MGSPRIRSPWLAALFAWVLATGLIAGGYGLWQLSQGEPIRWDIIRDAGLMAAPMALIMAWRDRKPRE